MTTAELSLVDPKVFDLFGMIFLDSARARDFLWKNPDRLHNWSTVLVDLGAV